MTVSTLMMTDQQIQQSVQDELAWTPEVEGAGIDVAVDGGTVTLSGEVDDVSERRAANRAALRTAGVTTIVDDLVVQPASYLWSITETDIARHVASAITRYAKLPDSVRASIDGHTVTLTGEVQWNYQREFAARAVENVPGVALVINSVTLHPRISAVETDTRIREALIRSAALDADTIQVTVQGTTITLTGHVRSFSERIQAERTAWASPHVTEVHDHLTVTS